MASLAAASWTASLFRHLSRLISRWFLFPKEILTAIHHVDIHATEEDSHHHIIPLQQHQPELGIAVATVVWDIYIFLSSLSCVCVFFLNDKAKQHITLIDLTFFVSFVSSLFFSTCLLRFVF